MAADRSELRARLTSRGVLGAVAVLATMLAAVTTWLAWTASAEAAAESVRITAAGRPDCAPGRDVNDGRRVLVVAERDRRCDVALVITNDSERTVRLDAVELPNVGTAEDSANQLVVAVDGGTGAPELADLGDGLRGSPATYDLGGRDLEPGETWTTWIGLELNETNCRGGASGLFPWPAVAVSVGGTQHRIAPSTDLAIRLAPPYTQDDGPGCAEQDG